MRTPIALLLSLAACASTPPSPLADPAPAARGECLAAPARTKPDGWVAAGTVLVTVADGKPVSLQVQDASGKTVSSAPVDASSPQTAREAMRQGACTAGGFVFVVGGKPPDSGPFPLAVFRPAKEDEAGDLAQLCAQPKDMPTGVDASQKTTIAAQMYGERLTSTRYRAWLHHLDTAVRADDAAARSKSLDELSKDAKGACWFADALRR